MQNLTLPYDLPDRPGVSWTEEIPEGAVSRGSATFTADSGSVVLSVWINGKLDNLAPFVKHVLGYSYVDPPFNESDITKQPAVGTYRLRRVTPARHPFFNNLRATKILSVQGYGLRQDFSQTFSSGGGTGFYGDYQYWNIMVQFEIPRYEMLSDTENENPSQDPGGVPIPRPEYRRFTEWFPESGLEIIARKGVPWVYRDPVFRAINPTGFVGDRLLRVPKTKLRVVTYDVHIDWVLLGRLIPRSMDNRIGTVNAAFFPWDARRDQNKALGDASPYAQYKPGTMLMMAPKLLPRTQNHPDILNHPIIRDRLPRTVDVEQNFVIFNPKSTDRSVIDLTEFPNGMISTPVRGHNLVPLPVPLTADGIWAVAINNEAASILPGFDVKQEHLLYQYSDFEALWGAVESFYP